MVYTLDQIKEIIVPIAARYNLKAVYVFGSYARGEANEDSDVDLLVDTSGAEIESLLQLAAVCCDFEDALGKQVDLITTSALEQKPMHPSDLMFRKIVWDEKVNLYDAA